MNVSYVDSSLGAQQFLEKVKEDLRVVVASADYALWIDPLWILEERGDGVTLAETTPFRRDWVRSNYGSQIFEALKRHWPTLKTLEFKVSDTPRPASQAVVEEAEETWDNGSIAGALDRRYTFETFVVGKPNEVAYSAAMKVSEDTQLRYNPLFLYGGVGLGKTHLMHAIAWRMKALYPKRRVIYISSEKFMYEFIRALRHRDLDAFKERFRTVDVLMIDDVQFMCGKESTQEEFFHTFNDLVNSHRQVIVSADKSPSDLTGLEERLRSRLGWGLVADIHPTTYELRLGILQAKTEMLRLQVSEKILEYLAEQITSSVRELEGALNRLHAHSSFMDRAVSMEMVQLVLKDLLRPQPRQIVTLEAIQEKVAERFGCKLSDLLSPKRDRILVRARQVAMYLAKLMTPKSYPAIGHAFGGRDHTTVLHAVRMVEGLMKTDPQIAQHVRELRDTFF